MMESQMNRLVQVAQSFFALMLLYGPAGITDEMPERGKTILVTGATGTQGGAVARELIKRGYAVRGLTRSPDKPAALALNELGVEVVKGDFDHPDSLYAAMKDVYGVFAVTDFWEHGYEGEVTHGRKLIEASEAAGVGHFVFTSVAGANSSTGIPHFDSKGEIERLLAGSDLRWSVIRPVEFMDNWRWSKDEFMAGRMVDARGPESHHQWIAASDIGFFAGESFDNPEDWNGRSLDIAGDEMSLGELADVLSSAIGVKVVLQQVSWEELEESAGEEITLMIRWFDEEGYSADVTSLRKQYPALKTVHEYISGLNWK
jgi:uncharacterized protein YbjT (DUF2867 family)